MKKLILTLSCLCLLALGASHARAEDGAGNIPRLGLEGGLDLTNFNGPSVSDVFGSRLGFVAGAFLQLPLGQGLWFQPELLFVQKGGTFDNNAYQENYLEVPLLLNVNLIGPLSLILGPSLDGNLYNSGINNFNNGDIGLVGGAQLNIASFLLSARYELGLASMSSTQGIENGTFTLLAGLLLL